MKEYEYDNASDFLNHIKTFIRMRPDYFNVVVTARREDDEGIHHPGSCSAKIDRDTFVNLWNGMMRAMRERDRVDMGYDVYKHKYLPVGTRVKILKRKYVSDSDRFYGKTGTVIAMHTYVGTDTFFEVMLDEPVIIHILGYGDVELKVVDLHKYDITKEGVEVLEDRNKFALEIPD